MRTLILLTFSAIGAFAGAIAQTTLTFTAELNGQHVPLDSVLTQNLTQGGDTTLHAPDTVLVLGSTIIGIGEIGNAGSDGFALSQNYPNPMNGQTTIGIHVAERKDFQVTVTDAAGRTLIQSEFKLGPGHHAFNFYPGNQSIYLFNAVTDQKSQTIKMINSKPMTSDDGQGDLEYAGKRKTGKNPPAAFQLKDLDFDPGDELQFTAYTSQGVATLSDAPADDQMYTFEYASAGIPCPDAQTLTDVEGNVYNTVLIGSQCWMKENLRTATYDNEVLIPNVTEQEAWSNLTTDAYSWYENDISWKDTYGALYNGYVISDSDNPICPSGWHVPSEEEWVDLFDFIGGVGDGFGNEIKSCRQVDSPLGGGCNTTEHPRFDSHNVHYGTDDNGFAGLPGGFRSFSDVLEFDGVGVAGYWWTSTEDGDFLETRYLHNGFSFVGGSFFTKNYGYSVRCVKD